MSRRHWDVLGCGGSSSDMARWQWALAIISVADSGDDASWVVGVEVKVVCSGQWLTISHVGIVVMCQWGALSVVGHCW